MRHNWIIKDSYLTVQFICRVLSRKHFKDVSQLYYGGMQGFSSRQLLVRFLAKRNSNPIMEVTHFSDEGKVTTQNFLFPETEEDFLKKINHR